MRWVCCGVSPIEKWRFEQLREMLGDEHELVFMDWKSGTDWLHEFDGFGHVRWGEGVQVSASKALKVHSSWTALLGITDGMLLREGRWWPLCASYEALWHTFTSMGQGLEMDASAFVNGTGAMARAGIAALFKCGFRRFRVTGKDVESCQQLVSDIRVKFLGIDLEVVPIDKIVLLAGISSVFINTVTASEAPELTQEISYLNFLKRPGALIDTSPYTKPTLLLKEAADSAIRTVDGWHLAARIDALWSEWAFGKKLDIDAYQKRLTQGARSLA